jgi:hypothetical protein
MANNSQALPIGRDNFAEIMAAKSFYYVDKSLMIQEFLERKNMVTLITRPHQTDSSA